MIGINDCFAKRIKDKHIDEKVHPVGMYQPIGKKAPSFSVMADCECIKFQPAKQFLVKECED